ncbi:N-acetyltransferase [Nitrosospira sp. NpAV]|uniref:N-acetyltransferase n=1 Tax=Nitrosospira sp. NpAV TaxID=58133 RepID=UPI0005A091E0|nr:N-acetyltransferase [Nitrosospira sp. NpAV]KIO48407.1 hypothetical protein SQ11_11725 [Nitrosospira sp. NpAV]
MDHEKIEIIDLRSVHRDIACSYLDAFIQIHEYESVFPDSIGGKDAEQWRQSFSEFSPSVAQMNIALALNREPNREPHVIGGLVFKHYRKSGCGLWTYFAVKPSHQEKDIATRLIKHVTDSLEILLLAEAGDPEKYFDADQRKKIVEQIGFFAKLGARKIDIPWLELRHAREGYDHLLCFPANQDLESIDRDRIAPFLLEFHETSSIEEPNPRADIIPTTQDLPKQIKLAKLPAKEEPALPLKAASVCLHFVERGAKCRDSEPDMVFGSMELDLLNYQFQVKPPLISRHLLGEGNLVKIIFPLSFQYTSEGRAEALICDQREKIVDCMLSMTEFKHSKIRIWHLTLSAQHSPLNEFEIIKLISLYDGRSEDTGPYEEPSGKNTASAKKKLANEIRFIHGNEELSIIGLISKLAANSPNCASSSSQHEKLALKSGTIQLLLKNEETKTLLWNAIRARSKIEGSKNGQGAGNNPHEATRAVMAESGLSARILRALSGITIGIFDFCETDFEEIVDTFEPSFEDGSVFIKFNRCTLLSIAQDDRAFEACRKTIGISPYLIIPHAVLIHNEELVLMAEETIQSVQEKESSIRRVLKLGKLETAYNAAAEYLHSWYLPIIFNYPTETILFKQGKKKRGSTQKHKMVQSQLLELQKQIEETWLLRRGIVGGVIASLLAFITATQATKTILAILDIRDTGIHHVFGFFFFALVLVLSLIGLKFKK